MIAVGVFHQPDITVGGTPPYAWPSSQEEIAWPRAGGGRGKTIATFFYGPGLVETFT